MPVTLNQTDLDHIPEDFTLESLAAHLTQGEIDAIQAGDDPLVAPAGPSPEEAAAQLAAEQAAVDAAAAATVTAQKPAVEIPDTTAAEQAIAQIDGQLDDLRAKFDDGDLTYAEWMQQQTLLIKQQSQAQVQIERAAMITSDVAAQRRQDFNAAMEAHKAAGNDFLWSPEHLDGWDKALRSVTGNSQYANSLPLAAQINLAHDLYAASVKAVTGKAIKAASTQPAPEPEPKSTGPRTDPRPEPVQTLAGFNGDTGATLDDGSFTVADRLSATDPLAAERLFASWSAEKREQYLTRV